MRTIKQQTTGWPDLRRVEIHGTYALRTQLWATWINGNCHRTLAWDPERESYVNSIKSLTQGKTIKRQTVLEHETDWIRKTIHIQYRSKSLKKDIPAGKDQGTFLGHTWQGIVPIPQWERITVSTVCVCVRVLAVEYIGQAMSFLMNPHAIQLQEPLYFSRILKCFITFDSEISFTEVQVWGKVCNVEPRFLHKILKVVL